MKYLQLTIIGTLLVVILLCACTSAAPSSESAPQTFSLPSHQSTSSPSISTSVLPPEAKAGVFPNSNQVTLLSETETDRTYQICSQIIEINEAGERRVTYGTFLYVVTLPLPLYCETIYIKIPGSFMSRYSDEDAQDSLKLADNYYTLSFFAGEPPEGFFIPLGDSGEDDAEEEYEIIDYGTFSSDNARTIYYIYIMYSNGDYLYSTAVDLGNGFAPCFSFFVFNGMTPDEWSDPAVFEAILSSVKLAS